MFQLILILLCLVLFALRLSYNGQSILKNFSSISLKRSQSNNGRNTKSPPVIPGRLPIIGHVHLLWGDNHHLWTLLKFVFDFSNNNGGVTMGILGPVANVYVVTDPEAAMKVATTCLDKPYAYKFMKCLLMDGLVTANAVTWKPHRKLLNPAFSSQNLNTFIDVFNKGALELVTALSDEVGKPQFDVHSYIINSLLDVATETTLGLSSNKHTIASDSYSRSVLALTGLICQRFASLWLHVDWIFKFSSLSKQHDLHHEIITKLAETEIEKRKVAMKEESTDLTPDKYKPLLDQLLIFRQKNIFTEDDVKGHLHTTLAGTFDTTASALNFILLFLGTYPEVQDRVYEEIKNVVGDRDVNKHDMKNLTYMEAVIKESLRLQPSIPVVARRIQDDLSIKDYTLKGGSICFIGLYGVNRHPMWGPDADQFRPERWLDQASLPTNAKLNATFSLGKRNCIGRTYANMVLKTYLTHILRRYRVHGDVTKLELKFEIAVKPVSGHNISLELRQ